MPHVIFLHSALTQNRVVVKDEGQKRWRAGLPLEEVVRVTVDSLYDAADEDSATGGPDTIRRVYPMVMAATAEGVHRIPDEQIGTVVAAMLLARAENPGG